MFRILVYLISVLLVLSTKALAAHDCYLDIQKPDTNEIISGHISDLLHEGYISSQTREQAQGLCSQVIKVMQSLFDEGTQNGLKIGGVPMTELAKEFSEVDIGIDTVTFLPGFGRLAGKTTQTSPTKFFNHQGAKRIILSLASLNISNIQSHISPEINRALVLKGVLAHELISVLGGKDNDYVESLHLLALFLDAKAIDVQAHFTNKSKHVEFTHAGRSVAKINRATVMRKGGASVVGSGGNDLAFSVKFLWKTLAQHLISGVPLHSPHGEVSQIYKTLLHSFQFTTTERRTRFIGQLLGAIVDDASCGPDDLYQLTLIQENSGTQTFVTSFCQSSSVSLEDLVKKDPYALDQISLTIANQMLKAIVDAP